MTNASARGRSVPTSLEQATGVETPKQVVFRDSIAAIAWKTLIAVVVSVGGLATARAGAQPDPTAVIDVHVHADPVADYGVTGFGPVPTICSDNVGITRLGWDPRTPFRFPTSTCRGPRWPASRTDDDLRRTTLATLARHNARAVVMGEPDVVDAWRSAAPGRVLPAVSVFRDSAGPDGRPLLRDIAELRRLVLAGRVEVFAEVGPQYAGMSPADSALDPYFALAEELDVPVGLHLGEGPPGGPNVPGYKHYRVALGNPLLLEPVLVRHPKLRLYVMHFGSPFVDDMIAMLFAYPQLYVDVSQNDWGFPRAHFLGQLRRLVDAGFSQRILFGSDQMIWPQAIDLSIETIESADFLTSQEKRDILHDNAVRFLRLDARRPAAAIPGRRRAAHDSADRGAARPSDDEGRSAAERRPYAATRPSRTSDEVMDCAASEIVARASFNLLGRVRGSSASGRSHRWRKGRRV
jgi:predicted TIM-barrel fold metal-dependent hydrolase